MNDDILDLLDTISKNIDDLKILYRRKDNTSSIPFDKREFMTTLYFMRSKLDKLEILTRIEGD